MINDLLNTAWEILNVSDPQQKVTQTYAAFDKFFEQDLQVDKIDLDKPVEQLIIPGRPDKPELVQPRELPRRGLNTLEGRATLLHAICHIEFNAINLALDAVYRFRDMPAQYYLDWLKVAKEEAYHFSLVRDYLEELGFAYGDFPAHNGLWEMAVDTEHDVLIRMALVPRVLEARGLDVTPGIMKKFESVNDTRANEILTIIERDEIGHVEIGSYWYRYCCDLRKVDHDKTFIELLQKYLKSGVKKPINHKARLQAGFTQKEIDYFESNL